ncbi:MAG: family N-acetyltransferase [Phycisphaerales bacterium]|nr:family N-acetyltransferase [Phycisphaerales bacterium]
MRWVGEDELDRVAEARMLCYAPALKELSRFTEGIRADRRGVPGDFLLAEQDGQPVGTATSHSFSMWLRGGRIPCQGVGFVGTLKTHRRGSRSAGGGVASRIMQETLRKAREREEVVSALMPFRGSFYEHFGYGFVERRWTWTLPLSTLPTGDFDGIEFYRAEDAPALAACRQRIVEAGECDIERGPAGWDWFMRKAEDGLLAVDRDPSGSIRGYLAFQHVHQNAKDTVNVTENGYEDLEGLRRQLHFLASLRDQYSFAALTLPADLPLNWLLRERQIPHRLVNHAVPEVRPCVRMQLRVLDHRRLIESMCLPTDARGKAAVAVQENEGHLSRFTIDVSEGRAGVSPSGSDGEFTCADNVWSAIVTGELPATQAVRLGLASVRDITAARLLDVFAQGPVPFCSEYF